MQVSEQKCTKTISTKVLRTGLELAEDVKTVQGYILASQGTILTHKHLKVFKAWGVTEVAIDKPGEAGKGEQAGYPEANEPKTETEVSSMFRKTDMEHEAIKEMYRLAVRFAHHEKEVDHGRSEHTRT